jgi:AraC-like DNA-binding protein/quercetin dioxygenase-like cupin family protein
MMSRKRQEVFNGYGHGPVRVLAWAYPDGTQLEWHQHTWHQLLYAVTGVMTVETTAGLWVVPANRAVWLPARTSHAIAMSGAVGMRALYVSPRLARTFPRDCRVVSVPALFRELILDAVQRGGLTCRRVHEYHLLEVILDFITTLPADSLRIDQVSDERAARVARALIDNPSERASLELLAKRAGASRRTIERAFRRETGLSFGSWRRRVRLVHALRLLAAGQPVTRVALEIGYDSVSAFVSRFRQTFGLTPGQYQAGAGLELRAR